jgi:hypothetical protein
LRERHARDGRQRDSAGGQIQEPSAGKFHGVPPTNYRWWNFQDLSGLIPADLITLSRFCVSSAMRLPKSTV